MSTERVLEACFAGMKMYPVCMFMYYPCCISTGLISWSYMQGEKL